jgi:hypothetical protein
MTAGLAGFVGKKRLLQPVDRPCQGQHVDYRGLSSSQDPRTFVDCGAGCVDIIHKKNSLSFDSLRKPKGKGPTDIFSTFFFGQGGLWQSLFLSFEYAGVIRDAIAIGPPGTEQRSLIESSLPKPLNVEGNRNYQIDGFFVPEPKKGLADKKAERLGKTGLFAVFENMDRLYESAIVNRLGPRRSEVLFGLDTISAKMIFTLAGDEG